jgi:hypothetical protein
MPEKSRNRKLGLQMGLDGLPRIDVEKSASHHLSQLEIGSDNPCYQHLSELSVRLCAKRSQRLTEACLQRVGQSEAKWERSG